MPGIRYDLDLDATSFRQGASQGMDYINQLHQRIDKLKTAGGGGGNGFLAGLSQTLFQLPQQVMALSGIMSTLAIPSKLAASAETTSVAFRTLVGDAFLAETTISRIRDLAAKTPFEFPELAQAARMLVAFGQAADTVPDTLRRIGDIAAGTSVSVGELAEIYGKARVQGTLFAEDINQMTGRGIPVVEEFAKILGVTKEQVKELASQGKVGFAELEQAFINLSSSGGKFGGMMDEMSGTMSGKLSNLTDAVKNVLTEAGKGINDAVKPLVGDLTAKVESMGGWGRKIGDAIGDGIDFGTASIKDGSLVKLLESGMLAASITFADAMMDGVDLITTRLAARGRRNLLDYNPLATDTDKEWADAGVKVADMLTMQSPGIGDKGLEAAKWALQDDFKKQVSDVQGQAAIRKKSRQDAEAQEQADRQQAKEDARVEAASKTFREKMVKQSDRQVQLESIANAKAVGASPEAIARQKADFLTSARENGATADELRQMRKDFGMPAVMTDKEAEARLKGNQATLDNARLDGRTPSEIQKMKSDFVANAQKEGMDGDSLDKMRKAFGMDAGTKASAGSLGSGANSAPGYQPLPLPGNANRDAQARERERERVDGGSGGAEDSGGQGSPRRIRSRSMADSIRAGFARQAGTGSGAVNWSTYVGRQIGLTSAQRSSLLRGGPDAQSLGTMTGRGQSRRAASAKAAAEETAKAGGQKEKADLERLVRQMAKNLEIIAKSVKEGGKL